MIDWQGLLKFTLKHTDQTKPTQFKQMKQEDRKWLQEALDHYTNSQIKVIKNLLQNLQQYQKYQEDELLQMLEKLQQLLDSLDKGSTLYKMGGHITILKIIFYSSYQSCKIVALQIYSSANQNQASIQNISINSGALQLVQTIHQVESMRLKQNIFGAISATIRGQNLQAKRIFIRIKGLQLMEQLLQDASPRLKTKIYTLLRDLLYYNDKLHLTHHDLSAFSNTNTLKVDPKKQYSLGYDPNSEALKNNELPENSHFKGMVKQFLQKRQKIFTDYLLWLKQQIKIQNQV